MCNRMDFSEFFLIEEIKNSSGKQLLGVLQQLFLKIYVLELMFFSPLVLFSIVPVTLNDIGYTGFKGLIILVPLLALLNLFLPLSVHYIIETSRQENK